MFLVSLACAQLAAEGTAGTIDYHHGYAFLAEPKYPPDFAHFDYVNPNAPKGGMLRRHGTGSWDSFNPAALRAAQVVAGLSTAAPHANFLHDSLLTEAADEPSTWYGRLASGIAIAPDGAWIAFRIRDHARWHDGRPLTVEDVAYTFKVYREDATSTISTPLEPIESIEVLSEWEIRFHIREETRGDPLLPIQIGQVPIIPKHYWETRDISRTTVEPPLGSGPYRVGEFQVGRWIRWERVPDYWGQDLPVMKGRFNFDVLKYDYFADDRLKTEAVKGDVIDFHIENIPGYWERDYDTPAFRAGVFRQEWLPVKQPWGLWWPVFWNLDQPRFQDVRVREALWLVSDFVWLNRTNFDFYGLATSYFHGSELAAGDCRANANSSYWNRCASTCRHASSPNPTRRPRTAAAAGTGRISFAPPRSCARLAGWCATIASCMAKPASPSTSASSPYLPRLAAPSSTTPATSNGSASRRASSRRKSPIGSIACAPATTTAAPIGSAPTTRPPS